MSERVWTSEQKDAIESRGGTVLVSAAAGSGKTAVLVERIMKLLTDEQHPVDADRLLAVTFSNAAAEEMRQRLGSALNKAIGQAPENGLLSRQLMLLQRGHISTVHSFCLELIRSNFHLLHISPTTQIGDEKELKLLRKAVFLQVMEEFYKQDKDGSFAELVELFSGSRDDRRMMEICDRLYDFLRAMPFYRSRLDKYVKMYENRDGSPGESPWGAEILDCARQLTKRLCRMAEETLQMCEHGEEGLSEKIVPVLQSDLNSMKLLEKVIDGKNWDGICQAVSQVKFSMWPRGGANTSLGAQLRERRDMLKNAFKKLPELFPVTEEQFRSDTTYFLPKMKTLRQLMFAFDDAFLKAKQQRDMMDYSDMEHYALRLLLRETAPEQYEPTELAKWMQSSFDEVLVDECQDTNQVQDLLYSALSDNSRNLFLVGDVKQSIYRFRQACPELFMERKDTYFPYDGKRFPALIRLSKNFRSACEVTDSINFFFSHLMHKEFAGIEYDAEEALHAGSVFAPQVTRGCEVRVLMMGEDDSGDTSRAEARSVAQRIRCMIDSGETVTGENGEARPMVWGDISILLRSAKGRSKLYLDALEEQGIPAWAESRDGFLHSRGVAPLLHLMLVLGNPLLDISMAAVLVSPLFDLTMDDLATLRKNGTEESLYGGLCQRGSTTAKNAARCRNAAAFFRRLRRMFATADAESLLLYAINESRYLGKLRVMPGAQAHEDNVMLFLEYARQYGSGTKGAAGFSSFLERLCQEQEDLSPAVGGAQSGNVVRIMTIHRSKGLEFPVVFLCDCAKKFNSADYMGSTLWNSELGIGMVRMEQETRAVYQTLQRNALKLQQERASLAEELRMLYVALTRAKERLILSGVVSQSWEKLLSKWNVEAQEGKLSSEAVRSAGSYLDWVMMCVMNHPHAGKIKQSTIPTEFCQPPEEIFRVRFVTEETSAQELETVLCERSAPDNDLLEEITALAEYRYPYEADTKLPSKLAVSALTKKSAADTHRFRSRPAFLDQGALHGAAKGTALHTFMQYADFTLASQNPAKEIERMRKAGFLSDGQAGAIDGEKVALFFSSPLGKRMFQSKQMWRELPFLASIGADIAGDYLEQFPKYGQILVQGIADCVFLEEDGAVIVDYKTDYVTKPEELIERYKGQLRVYKHILQQVLKVSVKECVLYSFGLDCAVVIEDI